MTTLHCKNCGKEISATDRRCPHCGQAVMTRRWAIALAVFGVVVALGFVWGHYTGRVLNYWEAGLAAGVVITWLGVKNYRERTKLIREADVTDGASGIEGTDGASGIEGTDGPDGTDGAQ